MKTIEERAAEAVTIRESGGCWFVDVAGVEEQNCGTLRESAELHAIVVRHQLAVAAGIAVAFINERADQVAREAMETVAVMVEPASEPVPRETPQELSICARTACRAPGAIWWNTSTRARYCTPCAHRINEGAPGLCVKGKPRETPAPSVSDRMAEVTAESRERAATPGGFDGGQESALLVAVRAHHAAMSCLDDHVERMDCYDTECRHASHEAESEAKAAVDKLLRAYPAPAAAAKAPA